MKFNFEWDPEIYCEPEIINDELIRLRMIDSTPQAYQLMRIAAQMEVLQSFAECIIGDYDGELHGKFDTLISAMPRIVADATPEVVWAHAMVNNMTGLLGATFDRLKELGEHLEKQIRDTAKIDDATELAVFADTSLSAGYSQWVLFGDTSAAIDAYMGPKAGDTRVVSIDRIRAAHDMGKAQREQADHVSH